MDWIESQLDDETIFPQRLGMFDISPKLVGRPHDILDKFFSNYIYCLTPLIDFFL